VTAMTAEASVAGLPTKRAGPGNWLRSYGAMLRWEVMSSRLVLPVMLVVQILVGAGFVIGFGLLIPQVDEATALYLATGGVVQTLILIGLIVTPQLVAQRKTEGSYDYLWSLPTPRGAASLASTTVAALVAIPGVVATLLVAVWRFDVSFAVHPTVVPAILLTVACGSFLGMAAAHGIPNPQVTQLLTQLMIFFVIGFSPVFFPPDRLPDWLATLHDYLPVYPMTLAVRSSLTNDLAEMTASAWIVLSVWTIVGALITGIVLVRRK
jgi:ABC-2 type transport system permease protein